MASIPSEEPPQAAEEGLPPALIAQAEAAIAGNLQQNGRTLAVRSKSYTRLGRSQDQDTNSASGNVRAPLTRARTHLGVPNILTVDGPEAPPAFGDKHDSLELSQDGFDTKARVTDDGRVNISINQKTRKLSDLLVPALRNQLSLVAQEEEKPLPPGYIPPALGGLPGQTPPPKLNVVIHVVGSRGDVQPFVALGKVLKATYGHRVRLATHPTFQSFVEENGLEFFSIGGDPSELMAFMVKNPGLMPGFDSLKSGDVGKRRKGMEEIVLGCWRSCVEAGDGLGPPPRNSGDSISGLSGGINMDTNPTERPFIADAIIANPPSFAHIHIAEKMGIPLHMMFTMPWSPTQSFPHPLANIQSSNCDVNMTNFVSYALVEMMTWQGLGDVINRFRERALGLDPISLIWAPGMLSRLRIPYTYCWSPALIPKPKDWGQHISISGFYFLSLASSYSPPPDLAEFLAAGAPPVYIGFGSIVVDDPDAMTKLIFEAVKKAGVRALVSKGWGGLGADDMEVPEGVFMLGNVPHDWLFKHVSCVVHHGGAGTTAAGIATGKPTVIVPFFGDQQFWGAMVARAGAGPLPIPHRQLTADKLAAAILEALKPETLEKAKELGAKIKEEKGSEQGGKSFHDMLDVDNLRCSLSPSRVAVWQVKRTKTRLSALAAAVLADQGLLDFADLQLYRPREYETEDGPWDPISGGASALLGTIASLTMGVADFPVEIFRSVKDKHRKAKPKENATQSSGSGSEPSTIISRDQPEAESGSEESAKAKDQEASEPSSQPDLSSAPSTKVSYDSEVRTSNDTRASIDTPLTSTSSTGPQRGRSLREALRGTLSRSRSRSGSSDGLSRSGSKSRSLSRRVSIHRTPPEFDPRKLTVENVVGAGKGISRIVGAGIKSPMDFTLGLARGFHNAPKLYGDDTVRPQEKVTDFQSGLKAAGREFGFGFYDGISGLITQPMRGAEKEGTAGLLKGIGKGIGGLIMKPGAAIWGLPGYTFLGIHKEVRKLFGSSVINYVISARTAQGYEEFRTSTAQERLEIITRWREHKAEYQNSKQKPTDAEGQDTDQLTPRGFFHTRHLSFDERKRLYEERKARSEAERTKVRSEDHTPRPGQQTSIVSDSLSSDPNLEFEQAIHASVAATSRGDLTEDRMIERAIRASVRELQTDDDALLDDQEALNRAIQASITEAARRHSSDGEGPIAMTDVEEAAHQAALEKAIQESLANYQLSQSSGLEAQEDENVRLAIRISRRAAPHNEESEDEDIKLAIRKSREAVVEREELQRARTEEEIVLEYVKKQSLIEEAHKSTLEAQSQSSAPGKERGLKEEEQSAADEEALGLAIEESLKGSVSGSGSGIRDDAV